MRAVKVNTVFSRLIYVDCGLGVLSQVERSRFDPKNRLPVTIFNALSIILTIETMFLFLFSYKLGSLIQGTEKKISMGNLSKIDKTKLF